MTSPLLALRAAILARLGPDPGLAALMGGAVRLYDEPPLAAVPVYAVFGDGEARDDSVDGARCSFSEKFPFSRTSLSQFSDKLVSGPMMQVEMRRPAASGCYPTASPMRLDF